MLCAQHQGRCGAKIQQPITVVAADVVGSLHGQGIGAGLQIENAGAIVGVTSAKRAVGDQVLSARPFQIPAQPVAVMAADIHREAVEVDALGLGQREGPFVVLARGSQRSADGLAQIERWQHHRGTRRHGYRDVVDIVVGAPAAIARAEGHAAVVGRHPGHEVIGDQRHLGAAIRREVDRNATTPRRRLHDDAGVVKRAAIQPKTA